MAVAQQLENAIRQVGFLVEVQTSGSVREKVGQRFDQSTETVQVWMSLKEQESSDENTIRLNMSGANEYKPKEGDVVIHAETKYKITTFKTKQLGNEITSYEITGVA